MFEGTMYNVLGKNNKKDEKIGAFLQSFNFNPYY